MNIFQIIRDETKTFTDKTAVIEGDTSISYGELISCTELFASVLSDVGVGQFHRVGLLCRDSIDYIIVVLAILSLSAVVVPVFPEQTIDEINAIVDGIALNFLIFERGTYNNKKAENLRSKELYKKELYFLKRSGIEEPCSEYYEINPAFIRFSSGTTGKNKGIVLSHEAIAERTDALDKGIRINSNDTVLWVLSMSFHFVVTILLFLRRASTIILCKNLFPESLIGEITACNVTILYASPFHYNLLCRSEFLSQKSLKNVRLAISTAMKLPPSTANEFYLKSGMELAEAFGIMEVGLPFINLSFDKNKRSTVGMPLPDYEAKIVNKDEEGIGEIYIKGKGMLNAYFLPWQNRNSILRNGWFKTGDLGKIDRSGFLTIIGRNKDIINFAGMKIFPYEVEFVINQHPLIKESLIYGVTHLQYGQIPMAKIVLKKEANNLLNLDDLRRFCYDKLSPYKVPKGFEFVDHLPETVSGKIKR